MFVDSSALVAIVSAEPEALVFSRKIGSAKSALISPIVLYESSVVIARLKKKSVRFARKSIEALLARAGVASVPIDPNIGALALDAFHRYGKGRHRASLNMGDCFSYACARAHKAPLLFKGDDFPLTDIEVA